MTGSKNGNHRPSANSETEKGYADPFFPNFPTDILVGECAWCYDHVVAIILGLYAAAFCLSVVSLPGP